MLKRKISAAKKTSKKPATELYYEYTTPAGVSVLLTRYEWARGLGLSDKTVKKAQAARHREVQDGLATTEEA